MWDDWRDIEASQAKADAEDAERRRGPLEPVVLPSLAAPDAPQRPVAPPQSIEEPYTTAPRPEPTPVQELNALRAFRKYLLSTLRNTEDNR